jgi:uncharacterized Fe-S cluster-containing radical SAM superfamily protein
MKPRSDVKLDRVAFEKMKRVLPAFLAAQRGTGVEDHSVRELPDEIAFKLTNRCNLRCKHCYQWNEQGHHRDLTRSEQRRDLDFAIIEKVFAATRERRSNVYLWGGEPLIYGDWDRLAGLLERDPRWTSMCTNGIGIESRLESILRISERFEILFAVEGFREEHDAIRGKSTWDRTMRGLDLLLEEKRQGRVARNFNWMCTDGEPARPSISQHPAGEPRGRGRPLRPALHLRLDRHPARGDAHPSQHRRGVGLDHRISRKPGGRRRRRLPAALF